MTIYPTEWQNGKLRGSINNKGNTYLVRYNDNIGKTHSQYFLFSKYGGQKQALECATQWLKEENTKYDISINKTRYLDENTIEVHISDNLTFVTDAKFIDMVNEYKIHVKKKKEKNGIERQYVMCQVKKTVTLFASKLCDYKIIKYVDGNSFNLKLNNLEEFGAVSNSKQKLQIKTDIENKTLPAIFVSHFNIDPFLPHNVWILGKPNGTIFKRSNTQTVWTVTVTDENNSGHTKTFDATKYESDINAKEAGLKWMYETSCKLNVTKNLIRLIDNEYIEVMLSQDVCVLIDKVFLPLINLLPLHVSKSGNVGSKYYCRCTMNGNSSQLHKLIMGDKMVDHLNNNLLDCRLVNLIWTNYSENNRNKITDNQNTGVRFHDKEKMGLCAYEARIKVFSTESSKMFFFKKDDKHSQQRAEQLAKTFLKNIYRIDTTSCELEFTGEERIEDLYFLSERLRTTHKNIMDDCIYNPKDYLQCVNLDERDRRKMHQKYIHIILWRMSNLEQKLSIVTEYLNQIGTPKIYTFENPLCYSTIYSVRSYDELKNMIGSELISETLQTQSDNSISKSNIKELLQVISSKDCILLTPHTDIKSNSTKLLLQCNKSHNFTVTYDEFVNQCKWCKECEQDNSSIEEHKLKEICIKFFDEKFVRFRPDWLRSKKGTKLELTLYCEKLALAFEYYNQYHYVYTPSFHATEDDFKKIQEHDKTIERLCKKHNVILIIIPFTLKLDEIETFVENKLNLYEISHKGNIQQTQHQQKSNKKILTSHKEDIKKTSCDYYLQLKKFVETKGGQLLSEKYDACNTKVEILCKSNHTFESTPNNIYKNKWCPICNVCQMEFYMGKILEHIFTENIFKKIRPCWLKFKNGANLELDYYCEKLSLAFEYNGKQHYDYIPHFHRTYEAYELQLERDEYKAKMCEKEGIKLIIVPYTIDEKKMYSYILSKLDDNDVDYVFPEKKFDPAEIEITNQFFDKTLDIIKQKGGEYINGTYITRLSDITIKCENQHTWTTNFGKILGGAWCHVCGTVVSDDRKVAISVGMKKFNESEEGKELKKISHEKRSETMRIEREQVRANITHKFCTRCTEDKNVSEFNKKSDAKDGLQPYCKECVMKIKREKKLILSK